MQIHHIVTYASAPTLMYEVQNGICLCKRCHYKIRNQESFYAGMFMDIVRENSK